MTRGLKAFSSSVTVLHCCLSTALAANFTASLDPTTIAMGETATLSLIFEGGQPQNVPTPKVPGLDISNTGTSSSFSFNNGQMSSVVTVTFSVSPRKTADFVIPTMEAEIGGQRVYTEPLKLKVVKAGPWGVSKIKPGSKLAFMRLNVPNKKVYPGEMIAARLQIFFRDDVKNYQGFQFTSTPADGFTIGKMSQEAAEKAQIGSRTYTVIPVSIALTSVKSGTLSVGPFSATVQIAVPGTNGPFASFFGGQQKQINLASDPVSITSLPLPMTHVPPSFNGAVGDFTMTASAGPTNVAVGDRVTLRVQISGRGSLNSIALPSHPNWNDFNLFSLTSKTETSDNLGDEGSKTFEEIVTPQNAKIHELPPISFSFFNPDDGNYHTLTQPATPLFVRRSGIF